MSKAKLSFLVLAAGAVLPFNCIPGTPELQAAINAATVNLNTVIQNLLGGNLGAVGDAFNSILGQLTT
jgi:hypothetical protein